MAYQTARMKNHVVTRWLGGSTILEGNVYGHPKFPDGEHVYTSKLVYLNEDIGIGVTKNTVYLLKDVPEGTVKEVLNNVHERT